MRIELVSSEDELVRVLLSHRNSWDHWVFRSYAEFLAEPGMTSVEGIVLLDIRSQLSECVRGALRHPAMKNKTVLLIHTLTQDVERLVEDSSFKGPVDVLPWPAPLPLISFRIETMRRYMRAEALRKAMKLNADRAALDSLGDKAPFLMLIWNSNYHLSYANAPARNFFSLRNGYGHRPDLISFVHNDDRDNLLSATKNAIRERKIFQIKARFRRHDGSWRWMRIGGCPFPGKIRGERKLLTCLSDVTDKRIETETLCAEERMFRELADSLPIHVWRTDAEGESIYFNKAWMEYTGLPHRYITDEEWMALEHPDDIPVIRDQWWEAILTGQPFSLEFRFREQRSGQLRWMWSRSVPFHNEQGKVIGWIGATIDVDDEKRETERISSLTRDLVNLDRVKDEFLLSLSQDMREPLQEVLRLCTHLLSSTTFEAEDHEALKTVFRSAAGLLHLVNELLDTSRIISATMTLELEPADLVVIVRSALQSLENLAEESGISLHEDLPQNVLMCVDPRRVHQIVWNVLNNAIKFSSRGDTVHVQMKRLTDAIILSVQDTGKGVDPSFMPRIFDLFAQEEGYQTRRHGGLGLGLPLVKYLTELHGGGVSVTSAGANQGTQVQIRFPSNTMLRSA